MARLTNIGISSAEVARALKDDEIWAEAVIREWRSDCAPVDFPRIDALYRARWPDVSGAVPVLTALKMRAGQRSNVTTWANRISFARCARGGAPPARILSRAGCWTASTLMLLAP